MIYAEVLVNNLRKPYAEQLVTDLKVDFYLKKGVKNGRRKRSKKNN